jgi:hypothetical protein
MKADTDATTRPMLPATNTSPFTAPRAASPWVRKNKNAAAVRKAPHPMPSCRTSAGPTSARSHSDWMPLSPIANPCASHHARPPIPATIRILAAARPVAPNLNARNGNARNTPCGRSQGLPCHKPWNSPGA